MNELAFSASEIKLKVIKLLRKTEQLESKCSELEAENAKLKNSLNEQKNSIKALEETNKMLKIAETLSNQDDKRELKKVINGYLKEIDECLRLLSNK
jgi:predicted RNase H-like nuclease (RuvC/YqgF family)